MQLGQLFTRLPHLQLFGVRVRLHLQLLRSVFSRLRIGLHSFDTLFSSVALFYFFTQVLVIFIIRTRGNPLKSHAHPLLTVTSLTVVVIAALLPFTPIGTYFGFVPPPAKFYFILGAMVLAYLFIVELVKQGFYRWAAPVRRSHRSATRA